MTQPKPSPSDEVLPPNRVVRWVMLAGVILFSVGLYFRFGLHLPPIGTVPPAPPAPPPPSATTTSP